MPPIHPQPGLNKHSGGAKNAIYRINPNRRLGSDPTNLNMQGLPVPKPHQPEQLFPPRPASNMNEVLLEKGSQTCKIANEGRQGMLRSPAVARPPILSTRRGRERFLLITFYEEAQGGAF